MGIHHTKENSQLKSSTNDNNTICQSTKKSLISNKQTNYYGWQEIYHCSHTDWLHGISGK